MSKQGNNSNAVANIDSLPASRYPGMTRGGHMGGGQHGGAASNNAPVQSYDGHFSAGGRPMGPRPINMGQSAPNLGQKRDSSGFSVGGGPNYSPRHGGGSQDSGDSGNFAKLFVGSVPRTVTEEDIHPLFSEHGNVLEVALIKDKRTGQQQVKYLESLPIFHWGCVPEDLLGIPGWGMGCPLFFRTRQFTPFGA